MDVHADPYVHPCLRCGACCAFFRVSWYYQEADDYSPGGVPVALCDDLNSRMRCMRGTQYASPRCRCVALAGDIGVSVRCRIHAQRPSVCREFVPSYENGEQNPDCDRARAAHGMAPLTPEDFLPVDPRGDGDRVDVGD